MTKTKQTTRKKLIYSTAAFIASTAIGSIPASAWTEQEARGAFEQSSEFTDCDLNRLVADKWLGSYKNTTDRVKIRIGEYILDGITEAAKRISQNARESQRYNSYAQCTFDDGKKEMVKLMDTGNNKKILWALKKAR